jgi:hypothetical protein
MNRPKHDRGKQGASQVKGFAVNGLSYGISEGRGPAIAAPVRFIAYLICV